MKSSNSRVSQWTAPSSLAAIPFKFYQPEMKAAAQERMLIENELREAMQRDEMEIHYQPHLASRCPGRPFFRYLHNQGTL
jgi:hypothetical protein